MKKKLSAKEIISKHHSINGSKGGNALFKKVGPEGMRALVNKRWKKKK